MATLAENIQRAINDFNSIENAIVEKGVEVPAGTPTSEYPEKISEVYEAGRDTRPDLSGDTVVPSAMREGYTAHDAAGQPITGTIPNYDGTITEGAVEGAEAKYNEGVADGKQAEYDAFWDAFQDYGNRTNYNMAFAGASWAPPEMLKPKYPIHPNDGGRAYSYEGARIFERYGKMGLGNSPLFDWKEITANMDIDLSSVSHPIGLFANANITNIDVDLSGAVSLNQTFVHSDCGCVDSHGALSIRLKVTEKCVNYHLPFGYSGMLAELILTDDSVIAANGLDLSWSPLSKASLTSIINALSDTTTGLTVTLRLSAVNTAFETAEGLADGSTSDEWTALVATKSNWTINLIDS